MAFIGYLVGSITIKGVELGTAGVLIVALVFGHFLGHDEALVEGLGMFQRTGPHLLRNVRRFYCRTEVLPEL